MKNATNATTETGIFRCPKYFMLFFPKNLGKIGDFLIKIPQVRCFLDFIS